MQFITLETKYHKFAFSGSKKWLYFNEFKKEIIQIIK